MNGNLIGKAVVDAAVNIHRELGLGLRVITGLPKKTFASRRLGVRFGRIWLSAATSVNWTFGRKKQNSR